MTVIMGIFLVRGNIIFGAELFKVLKEFLMPGYLVFCGIMIGYLIAVIWQGKLPTSTEVINTRENIFKKSFLIGVSLGVVLAVCYVFY